MTRVLVVDDSRFMRTVLEAALCESGFDVETAADGSSAVSAVEEFEPDVVTMDVEMPGVDGIEAVDRIMSRRPTPIVMLSAYTSHGAEATLDALERGAVDFLCKPDPSGSRNIADLAEAVVTTVERVTSADVSELGLVRSAAREGSTRDRTRRPAVPGGPTPTSAPEPAPEPLTVDPESVVEHPTVIVGASTGGPTIVENVLSRLPIELGAKVLVVQHMPAEFTERFADRLDDRSTYSVREARDGDRIGDGEILVARGGHHLVVVGNETGTLEVALADGERRHGVKPAIDVTMESAAETVTDPTVGVVCSGMGRDGAAGVEALSTAGATTIAQNEQTCPVFGIPKRAIETGAIDHVLPAEGIVDGIVEGCLIDGDANG